jgi:hypothetical protein
MFEYINEAIGGRGILFVLLIIMVAWSSVWKLLALWKAARKNSVGWFIALAIINTVGILEILYIYVFSEKGKKKSSSHKKKRR